MKQVQGTRKKVHRWHTESQHSGTAVA